MSARSSRKELQISATTSGFKSRVPSRAFIFALWVIVSSFFLMGLGGAGRQCLPADKRRRLAAGAHDDTLPHYSGWRHTLSMWERRIRIITISRIFQLTRSAGDRNTTFVLLPRDGGMAIPRKWYASITRLRDSEPDTIIYS